MAEAILLSIFGVFASPVISKLVTDSMRKLGTDYSKDLAKDLEDLKTTILPELELTIRAAKHRPPNEIAPLTKWVARLRDAYIDAASILYEVKSNVRKPSLLSWGRDDKNKKLLKRLKKLKEVAAKAHTFRDLLGPASSSRPVTTGDRTAPVFGRDEDRDKIIEFLMGESNYSVVRVVTDMGGAGKTTLAQYIYNNETVKEHFSLRMWFCLSQKLDITELTKQMIECVSEEPCPNISNPGVLQRILKAKLPESGNIMVILDDVWYDGDAGEQPWSSLFAPFASFASRGPTCRCKFVVTSRSQVLPRNLRGEIIEWRDLEPRHFKSLLRYRTIDDLQLDDQQLNDQLSGIVNQIAEKMSEMSIQPLEAEFVGNQLFHQPNTLFWRATLKVIEEFERIDVYFRN